jgi:hypothetical protein
MRNRNAGGVEQLAMRPNSAARIEADADGDVYVADAELERSEGHFGDESVRQHQGARRSRIRKNQPEL